MSSIKRLCPKPTDKQVNAYFITHLLHSDSKSKPQNLIRPNLQQTNFSTAEAKIQTELAPHNNISDANLESSSMRHNNRNKTSEIVRMRNTTRSSYNNCTECCKGNMTNKHRNSHSANVLIARSETRPCRIQQYNFMCHLIFLQLECRQ